MNITRNQPFHVVADHDGLETTSYDLSIDGSVVASQPAPETPVGAVVFSNVLVSAVGAHVAAIRAVGPGGTASSADVAFTVVAGAPNAPTNVRLIVIA